MSSTVNGAVPDNFLNTDECPGTFRWTPEKCATFPLLPSYPSTPVEYCKGWGAYLHSRGAQDLVNLAKSDPAMLDALSFPVTLLSALKHLKLNPGSWFRVVVLGASRRAEERTARSTTYWEEIAYSFPLSKIKIDFVGPELSKTGPISSRGSGVGLEMRAHRGTLCDFLDNNPEVTNELASTVFIVFNGGFGNFIESHNFSLLWSWLPDLMVLTKMPVPLIFTCANDYADVRGEVEVMTKLVGVRFLRPPVENSVGFATTLLGEGVKAEDPTGWSRGNSYWYATWGYDAALRMNFKNGMSPAEKTKQVVQRFKASRGKQLKISALDGGKHVPWGRAAALDTERGTRYEFRRSDDDVVLVVSTEGLQSMADAYLEIAQNRIYLKWQVGENDSSTLDVALPRACFPEGAKARFNRRRQELRIWLPTAPQP